MYNIYISNQKYIYIYILFIFIYYIIYICIWGIMPKWPQIQTIFKFVSYYNSAR